MLFQSSVNKVTAVILGVLDAACQAVEWLSQPLGLDSLALRRSTRRIEKQLDNALPSARISTGKQRLVLTFETAPIGYRGRFAFQSLQVCPILGQH